MVMVSTIHNQVPERRVRFTHGTCIDGIDYGPGMTDRPVTLPNHVARYYVEQRRRAVYCDDEQLALQPEPEDAVAEEPETEEPVQPAPLVGSRRRGRRKK